MFKRFLIRFVLKLLDESFAVDYKKIDKKSFEQWAYDSYDKAGWRSYFAYEDMKILKSFGQGKEGIVYWMNIGRRLQLLYLFDEMRRAYELRKSEAEKKRNQAEKDETQKT